MTPEHIEKSKRLVAELRRITADHPKRDAILESCDDLDRLIWGPRVVYPPLKESVC